MPRLRISTDKYPLLVDRLRVYDQHEANVQSALELVKQGATVACAHRSTGVNSKTIAMRLSHQCVSIRNALELQKSRNIQKSRVSKSSALTGPTKQKHRNSKAIKHYLLTTNDPTRLHLTFDEELQIAFHIRKLIARNGPFPYQLIAEILRYYVRIRDSYRRLAEQDNEEHLLLNALYKDSQGPIPNITHSIPTCPHSPTRPDSPASPNLGHKLVAAPLTPPAPTNKASLFHPAASIPSPASSSASSPPYPRRASSVSVHDWSSNPACIKSVSDAPPSPPETNPNKKHSSLHHPLPSTLLDSIFSEPHSSRGSRSFSSGRLVAPNSLISARILEDATKPTHSSNSATKPSRLTNDSFSTIDDLESSLLSSPATNPFFYRSKPKPSIIRIQPSFLTTFCKRNGIQSQTIASLYKSNAAATNSVFAPVQTKETECGFDTGIARRQTEAFVQDKIETYSALRTKLVEVEFVQQQKQKAQRGTDNDGGLDSFIQSAFSSPEMYQAMIKNIGTGRVLRLCFLNGSIMDTNDGKTSKQVYKESDAEDSQDEDCEPGSWPLLHQPRGPGLALKFVNCKKNRETIMERLSEYLQKNEADTDLMDNYCNAPCESCLETDTHPCTFCSHSPIMLKKQVLFERHAREYLLRHPNEFSHDDRLLKEVEDSIRKERRHVDMYVVKPRHVIDAMFEHLEKLF